MKFNISVDVDWVGEDCSLDDEIKKEMALQITNTIVKEQTDSIKNKVQKSLESAFNGTVEKKINDIIEGWLNGDPVVITDSYGDAKETYHNIRHMLKARFDGFTEEKVDDNGRVPNYHNNGKMTRLEFFMKKYGQEVMEKEIINVTKKVSKEMESFVEDAIKNHVGNQIFKSAGLGKILNSYKKAIEITPGA